MSSQRLAAALQACRLLNHSHPTFADGWRTLSRIALALGNSGLALEAIERSLSLEPRNFSSVIQRAQCLLAAGQRVEAVESLEELSSQNTLDADAWNAAGTVLSAAGEQRRALAAYVRAVAMKPDETRFIFNRATVHRFVGDLESAEHDYDEVIARNPKDFEAYLNRSDLRTQTAERNHIAELEAVLKRALPNWQAEVHVRFALAKEYEDTGRFEEAFVQLSIGNRCRRENLNYDVRLDVATVDWIVSEFPGEKLRQSTADTQDQSAIFVVGLPRSGTTLIERVLTRHTEVAASGELDSFAIALVEAVVRLNGERLKDRRELVKLSASLNFTALGAAYLSRARSLLGTSGRFVDKMPLNYLYCGLIQLALPHAPIVHATRHPMAVCYAMYKTLFKAGYPFSYDLGEIAEYYSAYRRLMRHWKEALGEIIHEVPYEQMVGNLPGEAAELLRHCGLDWQARCIEFHQNPIPTTTASASQVRRPLYDTSVSQWRHYERQLESLRERLIKTGIPAEELA